MYKVEAGSRVTFSIFSLEVTERVMPSKVTLVGTFKSANEYNLTFFGIQHKALVRKPEIEYGDAFRNLSQTSIRI